MAPTPEYQLPGGGIDAGENPLSALHREVLEETGWRITKPRLFGTFRRFTYMPEYAVWAEKLCFVYVARPVFPVTRALEEGHTPHWVAAHLARNCVGNSGDRAMVSRFLNRAGQSQKTQTKR